MLGVGGYALVGPAPVPVDEAPVPPLVRPLSTPPPVATPGVGATLPVVPPLAPVNATIQLRTSVTERGRVMRGRTGGDLVGEINPQPLVLPRPHGAPQAYRIEVEGYDPAVVELHEADPPVVLVPLNESARRHRPHAGDHPDARARPPTATPEAPVVPARPPAHSDGLRDPWN